MENDLEHDDAYDELDLDLPPGWYLLSKKEYGEEVFFCQHEETLQSTNTYEHPADAVREARATVDPAESPATTTDAIKPTNGTTQDDGPNEVLDEDEGEYVKVTPELQAEARHAVNQIQAGILVTAYWIARIYDDHLYVGLGCNSKSEFVGQHLPFGERQARRYAKVGRRLGRFLPQGGPEQLPEPGSDAEEVPESLQGLNMGKLQELTKLDDEDLQDYVEEGKWTGPNGQTYTREDVIEMARTELGDAVSEKVKKMRETLDEEKEKRQDYQELAAKRKEENEALEEKLNEEKERIETAQDLERRLGPTASKLEEKRKTLDECAEHLDEAIRLAGKIGINADDPEADQQNLQRLMQRAQTFKDVLREDYAEVFMELGL